VTLGPPDFTPSPNWGSNIWIELVKLWQAGRVPQSEFMRLTAAGARRETREIAVREVAALLRRHRQQAELESIDLL
jgi:hypothetical protein